MRTIDSELQTAMQSGSYEPYIRASFKSALLRNPDGSYYEGFGPAPQTVEVLKFTLTDETAEIVIETIGGYGPANYGRFYLSRGAVINGTPNYINSGYFYAREVVFDGRLITVKGNIFPQDYAIQSAETTYQAIIEDILDKTWMTADYEDTGADWLTYQFYPTGKFLSLNRVERFVQTLRQKYFIFFAQNAGLSTQTKLKFFIGTETKASIDYSITDELFKCSNPRSLARQYISRDETESLVRSGNLYDPIHNLGFLASTAAHPAHNTAPLSGMAKIPINLEYETGDYITINPSDPSPYIQSYTGRIKVTEIFDPKINMTWFLNIEPLDIYSNTEAGGLPSTVLQVSSYIPLTTANFNNNLTEDTNNIQALADRVDDMQLFDVIGGHGDNATIPASTTYYITPFLTGLQTTTKNYPYPVAGVLKNLYLRTPSSQPASGTLVLTLVVGGVDSALVLTIPAGSGAGVYSETSTSVSIAEGDLIRIKIQNNATAASCQIGGVSLAFKGT